MNSLNSQPGTRAPSAVLAGLGEAAASRVRAVGHDAAQAAHLERLGAALAASAVERGLVRGARLAGGRRAETGDANVTLLAPAAAPPLDI